MNSNKVLLGAVTVACAAMIGCAGKSKQQQAPPTPAQQAVSQLDVERNGYVSQTQARIDQMSKFASDLKTNAAGKDKARAKKMENASDDLSSLLEDVRKELADVTGAAPQNWVDEKRDVEKSLSRAETQYSSAVTLLQ